MLRLAYLLAIAAQLLAIPLFVHPTGRTAIAFSFVGNPLLAVALAIGAWRWWRTAQRRNHGTMAPGSRSDADLHRSR